MAITIIEVDGYGKYDPPVKILCLDSDVAALPESHPIGSEARTTDTNLKYIFSDTGWVPLLPYVVYGTDAQRLAYPTARLPIGATFEVNDGVSAVSAIWSWTGIWAEY